MVSWNHGVGSSHPFNGCRISSINSIYPLISQIVGNPQLIPTMFIHFLIKSLTKTNQQPVIFPSNPGTPRFSWPKHGTDICFFGAEVVTKTQDQFRNPFGGPRFSAKLPSRPLCSHRSQTPCVSAGCVLKIGYPV